MTDEPNALWELPPDVEERYEAIIKKLHREGNLPSLERVSEVLLQTKEKYREKILKARRGGRNQD